MIVEWKQTYKKMTMSTKIFISYLDDILTVNKPIHIKQCICDDCELVNYHIASPTVIMQNYLGSYGTSLNFDWLCILLMNSMMQASCKALHTGVINKTELPFKI